jgi:hypothetical protein
MINPEPLYDTAGASIKELQTPGDKEGGDGAHEGQKELLDSCNDSDPTVDVDDHPHDERRDADDADDPHTDQLLHS